MVGKGSLWGCVGAIEVFGIASWRPQGQSRRWMGLIVAGIGFEDGSAKEIGRKQCVRIRRKQGRQSLLGVKPAELERAVGLVCDALCLVASLLLRGISA
jgi:hypothetical protein